MFGRHIPERGQARVDRLELGQDFPLGELRECLGGETPFPERVGGGLIRRGGALLGGDHADISGLTSAIFRSVTAHPIATTTAAARVAATGRIAGASMPARRAEHDPVAEADGQPDEFCGAGEPVHRAEYQKHRGAVAKPLQSSRRNRHAPVGALVRILARARLRIGGATALELYLVERLPDA